MSGGGAGGDEKLFKLLYLTLIQVSPATFAHFAHTLMGVAEAAGGRVCAVLEGGYFPPSLAEGAALTLRSEIFTFVTLRCQCMLTSGLFSEIRVP